MQVIEVNCWNSHWWQRQAGPGLQGAYEIKSDYLSVFQLISGLKSKLEASTKIEDSIKFKTK